MVVKQCLYLLNEDSQFRNALELGEVRTPQKGGIDDFGDHAHSQEIRGKAFALKEKIASCSPDDKAAIRKVLNEVMWETADFETLKREASGDNDLSNCLTEFAAAAFNVAHSKVYEELLCSPVSLNGENQEIELAIHKILKQDMIRLSDEVLTSGTDDNARREKAIIFGVSLRFFQPEAYEYLWRNDLERIFLCAPWAVRHDNAIGSCTRVIWNCSSAAERRKNVKRLLGCVCSGVVNGGFSVVDKQFAVVVSSLECSFDDWDEISVRNLIFSIWTKRDAQDALGATFLRGEFFKFLQESVRHEQITIVQGVNVLDEKRDELSHKMDEIVVQNMSRSQQLSKEFDDLEKRDPAVGNFWKTLKSIIHENFKASSAVVKGHLSFECQISNKLIFGLQVAGIALSFIPVAGGAAQSALNLVMWVRDENQKSEMRKNFEALDGVYTNLSTADVEKDNVLMECILESAKSEADFDRIRNFQINEENRSFLRRLLRQRPESPNFQEELAALVSAAFLNRICEQCRSNSTFRDAVRADPVKELSQLISNLIVKIVDCVPNLHPNGDDQADDDRSMQSLDERKFQMDDELLFAENDLEMIARKASRGLWTRSLLNLGMEVEQFLDDSSLQTLLRRRNLSVDQKQRAKIVVSITSAEGL
eukprot:TRINITY_DN2612_c0_g1_i8.p1 TRINITY_DN2612_c0_g1~~TRINITY_DN2612_c0_g1_i8.p1  ORF type:complete len:650 (-),score=159.76 TRINITY_DN2612_c0_g1_i8:278-2227(-)